MSSDPFDIKPTIRSNEMTVGYEYGDQDQSQFSLNLSNEFSGQHSDVSPNSSLNAADGDNSNKKSKNFVPGRKEDKICGVCGDKALGYNFDAISCESCKAFFRRNALKGINYFKCPYDNNCCMDVSNRRFCKRCRLKKCFEVGMRKEYILSEEDKLRKRRLVEQNRKQRQLEKMGLLASKPHYPGRGRPAGSSKAKQAANRVNADAASSTAVSLGNDDALNFSTLSVMSASLSPCSLNSDSLGSVASPDTLTPTSASVLQFNPPTLGTPSKFPTPLAPPASSSVRRPLGVGQTSVDDVAASERSPLAFRSLSVSDHELTGSASSVPTPSATASNSARPRSESNSSSLPPVDAQDVIPMSPEDSVILDELIDAYDASLRSVDAQSIISKRQRLDNFSDVVNVAEISIRRVINMAKRIDAFRALNQNDQINLLKSGSIELLILRSALAYDKERGVFLDPTDNPEERAMTTEQLHCAEAADGIDSDVFANHMRFVHSLLHQLQADRTSLIILLTICLFSADRPGLSDVVHVTRWQERYSQLLASYLHSSLPSSQAQLAYPRLLMKLSDIRLLDQQHTSALSVADPKSLRPLMQEVLDFVVD